MHLQLESFIQNLHKDTGPSANMSTQEEITISINLSIYQSIIYISTYISLIKGSLEEILPSYEKLRSVSVQVRDAKRSRLTVARVGTLGAARFRRGCGAVAAAAPVEIEA